jgi:hypothetical protein
MLSTQGRRLRFAKGRDNYGERSQPKFFLLGGTIQTNWNKRGSIPIPPVLAPICVNYGLERVGLGEGRQLDDSVYVKVKFVTVKIGIRYATG